MTHSIVWARTYIHVQLYNTLFNRLSHHIWSILLVHYSNSIPRIRSQNHPTTVGGTLCIWYGWLVESISQPTRETLYKFWPLLWPRTVPFKSKTSNIENICFTDRDQRSQITRYPEFDFDFGKRLRVIFWCGDICRTLPRVKQIKVTSYDR